MKGYKKYAQDTVVLAQDIEALDTLSSGITQEQRRYRDPPASPSGQGYGYQPQSH